MVVAAHLLGLSLASRKVEFLCDNEAVVSILKSGTSRDQHLMALLHYLSLLAVHYCFAFICSSVQGKANTIADCLSCFQFQHFALLADWEATPIPL